MSVREWFSAEYPNAVPVWLSPALDLAVVGAGEHARREPAPVYDLAKLKEILGVHIWKETTVFMESPVYFLQSRFERDWFWSEVQAGRLLVVPEFVPAITGVAIYGVQPKTVAYLRPRCLDILVNSVADSENQVDPEEIFKAGIGDLSFEQRTPIFLNPYLP